MERQHSKEAVKAAIKTIIEHFDTDAKRQGLQDTPKRYYGFLNEFLNPPDFNFTTFQAETDQMVIVKDIEFQAFCEHHIAPFYGTAHVGYIPGNRMAGISKLARSVETCSRKLTNQERIGSDILQMMDENLNPAGVMVVLEATHTCMCMRGVRKPGAVTVTSHTSGCFRENKDTRDEFLSLIK